MNNDQPKLPITGSTRKAVLGAKEIAASNPQERITVTLYARRNPRPPTAVKARHDALSAQLPGQRKYLDRQEFDQLFGADPNDLAKIRTWAAANNLQVKSEDVSKRQVTVEGTVDAFNKAFSISLHEYQHGSLGKFRGRTGDLCVSDDVYKIIDGVFGLDTRPIGKPRSKKGRVGALAAPTVTLKKGVTQAPIDISKIFPGAFLPTTVAQLYSYPANTDGAGQNLAIFSFNGPPSPDKHGGYKLDAVNAYFKNVIGVTPPTIQDVVIQGKGNNPGPDTPASEEKGDSTGEVMLDLCIAGAVCPGAKIFMYFTEFTSKGWVDAIHDAIAGKNNISVISISYGNPEKNADSLWTDMGVKLTDQAFEAAAALGITICCASGDDGSSDEGTGPAEVDYPASSPHVLAVGGTKLVAAKGKIKSERVWNEIRQQLGASGGGVSVIFSKPEYQDSVNVPVSANPPHQIGRGLPDVAAVGDPNTGVVIMHVDGKSLDSVGGTSAAAPLWAALIARLNQGLKARCGFLNVLLYSKLSKGVLNDIVLGNNGAYPAGKGWDACTGFGSPNGQRLLAALKGNTKKRNTR